MNKRSMHIFWVVLSILAGFISHSVTADTITLRADEWCPYTCIPESEKPGYMIEIAKRIFEFAGHQVDYRTLNWARAIEETRSGKFNGIVGAAKGDAPDFIFPSEPVGVSVNAFAATKSSSWNFTGIDSLNDTVLGVIRDYSYGTTIDAYVEANKNDPKKIQVLSGDDALGINLRKLQKGRLSAVVDGLAVLNFTFEKLGLKDDLRIAGMDDKADDIFIAFDPSNPKSGEYAEMLSRGIAKLRASGELKEILAKYGLNDWK